MSGSDVHPKPPGFASDFDPLPCNNQHNRESQWRSKTKNPPGEPLARREDAPALGGLGIFIRREELPEDQGLQRPLDFGSRVRPVEGHPY